MLELSCRDEPLAALVVVLPGELGPAVTEAQQWQTVAQLVRQETRQTFVAVRCFFFPCVYASGIVPIRSA